MLLRGAWMCIGEISEASRAYFQITCFASLCKGKDWISLYSGWQLAGEVLSVALSAKHFEISRSDLLCPPIYFSFNLAGFVMVPFIQNSGDFTSNCFLLQCRWGSGWLCVLMLRIAEAPFLASIV